LGQGFLLSCDDYPGGGRVYYVRGNERRHVLHAEWLTQNDLSPTDIRPVSQVELSQYRLGPPVPLTWTDRVDSGFPQDNSPILREVMTSRLNGSGMEIGAGHNPCPVPLHCSVSYADHLSELAFLRQYHGGQQADVVSVDLVLDIENMDKVPEESLDFLIAAHVIEHTRNPLAAFEQAYRKLRPGGHLVLMVPEKRNTFDPRTRDHYARSSCSRLHAPAS
jgi:hypothetical protein